MTNRLTLSVAVALCLSATAALADDARLCSRYVLFGEYELAFKPCKALAEQGNASAQSSLGYMYELGLGVTLNYDEALHWYRAAAEQGLARAQNNLGLLYEKGWGVPQNFIQAHAWYNIAAANGGEYASEDRNRIASQMTSQQIAEAQALAVQCMNSNYTEC